MAVLRVLSGDETGRVVTLAEERTILGRHPNCQVVLDNAAVSRHHAQILQSHGTFYLEDLRSRNGTFLNGQPLDSRALLNDGDQIRVCDIVVGFQLRDDFPPSSLVLRTDTLTDPDPNSTRETLIRSTAPGTSVSDPLMTSEIEEFDTKHVVADSFDDDLSSIIAKVDSSRMASDAIRLGPNSDVKLKAILEISQALRRELELDAVLPKILAVLFGIFPQADEGFILLRDAQTEKMRVKATRARGGNSTDEVAVSMTVVRQVIDSGEALLSRDVLDDSRFKKSTSLPQFKIRAMMCVPLMDARQEAIGVIQIDTRSSDPGFTEEDLDLLVAVASQAGMALENARLHEAVLKQREIERDLEFATQVQLGFLPKERPKVPGYAFADYYEAAMSVGGDYFDYIALPDGRLAIALGDVAGKGMPAALLMARLYASTRFELFTSDDPGEALSRLNKDITGSGIGHRFVTFVVMILEPATGKVIVVNAGHIPPQLRRANGKVEPVAKEESGLPLGIMPEQEYHAVTVQLNPGDTLLAITDGITEAMNDKRQIYGRERLKKCVAAAKGGIVAQVKALISDVETFSGGGGSSRDDTCCVGVERLAQSETSA